MGRAHPPRKTGRTCAVIYGMERRQWRSRQFYDAAIQLRGGRAGVNFARFCYPKLEQLIQETRTSSDRAQRTQAYLDAQQIIHEQALWIPLGHPNAAALIRGTVSGYRVSPYGRQNFATVLIR